MTRVLPTPEAIYTDGQQLVILRKHGGVAMMGGCTRCGRKFFTPSRLCHDAFGTAEYLRQKFDVHDCEMQSRPHPRVK